MGLLNYTTQIDVAKTVGEIHAMLARSKAQAILTKYDAAGKIPKRLNGDKEQAARVAWRIVKDWLEAQLAILETQSVKFEEIMLPFAVDPKTNQTVYQKLVAERFSTLAIPQTAGS